MLTHLQSLYADWFPITSSAGVLATLSGVCAFFFWLEKSMRWKFFQYVPSLIFIYLVPVILANSGLLTGKSPVYDVMQSLMLPMMLVLLLLNVNVGGVIRVMGRGMGVMLFGTVGVMVGAPVGLLIVKHWLGPEAWKAYGSLAGSWIGGTANMAAVTEMIGTPGTEFGLAVLADSTISYLIWLPILLASKKFADRFGRFTGVKSARLAEMDAAIEAQQHEQRTPESRDYLFLLCVALAATWVADLAATSIADVTAARWPDATEYVTQSTWRILLITTIGIGLSFTPLRRIPGSQALGMAFVFLFVARMGASAELTGVAAQAAPFLVGAVIGIFIHGAFCVFGAWLLRVDLHTAAIASAANIGGVASASIVASYHKPGLVPASILMALIGYAIGNYCGYVTALLCRFVS
jgi:uncharacterized membrane protein